MSGAHTRASRVGRAWRGHSGRIGLGVVAVVAALGVAGGLVWSLGLASTTAASAKGGADTNTVSQQAQTSTDPLSVLGILPETGNGAISGAETIVVELSEPLAADSPLPQISISGTWARDGDSLVFQPSLGLMPSSSLSLSVPGGANGLKGANGSRLSAPLSASWTVEPGSLLRVDQLLATLGYLPVTWTPSSPAPMSSSEEADAMYTPPDGSFAWRYPNTPPQLQAMWAPGQDNVLLRGAVMAFEAHENLKTDGQVGPQVWTKLLQATSSPQDTQAATNSDGYTYTFVSKSLPENMTVWHDGAVVVQTAVNTGIPVSPTADGTFPVYERLQSQIMKGTNPNGSHYADPVSWVAYFNGGDAVHYIARGAFGYPQSLGCVEAPLNAAAQAWPYLTLGSLVTISG